ncbi:threonine aldolase [Xylaria nigripes]|nr:threonine aldolase [Xylaria nigripes]
MADATNGVMAHHTWLGHQGAAAFDLRSDTMTTPTQAMLSAIQTTTLLDDVFQEDPTTTDLEAHVAALTGKEAGLFVLSGTMGNQLALRSLLTQPPHSVLCDSRSHIVIYEAGGVSSLTGAMLTPVTPRNERYLTLEEVKEKVIIGDNIHSCPTRVISLENSLNGMIMPLDEVRRISAFARANGIHMHCDGARLWEVVSAGAGSLPDFCACFDTINLCFSKGLGAPIGSILVGTERTLKHARWMRKAIGGGLRQSGVVTAAARVAVDVTFGKDPNGRDGLLKATHDTARRVADMWTALGGKLTHPVETNMCWLDLRSLGCNDVRFVELGKEVGLKLMGGRLITHYQIGEAAIEKLAGIFRTIARENKVNGVHSDTGRAAGIYGGNTIFDER